MSAQSTYAFKARTSSGEVVSGTMVAASADEVSARLRAEGQFVFEIEASPLRTAPELDKKQIRRNEAAKRVRRDDVIALCTQLSVMLETGVPLAEGLDAFRRQMERAEFREVLEALCDDIDGGEPLSAAMQKWPRVFPGMVVSLMKASEASGTLATMLGRVGDYLAKERKTVKQIKGALAYPIFMMVAGLGITIFLVSFVLPRFAAIYEQRQASLPTPTRILLDISEFVTTQYLWYGPMLVATGLALFIWIRRRSGRQAMDWLRLNLPMLGSMYRHLYVTRAMRTMATLLAAGVNVLDVIDICRGVTDNIYYARLWDAMALGVREGRQVSDAIFDSDLVPPNVASMIAAGERSGQLPVVMEKIADFSQEELDAAVARVTVFIEPLMIVFMGILIGGVATALLLPIFQMGKVMSGG
ncbi:MAG: type II secretion system F family protein [Planctomycetes bacterium]|nr:type II secretion system F family protein [Planctomycetota bacterium]